MKKDETQISKEPIDQGQAEDPSITDVGATAAGKLVAKQRPPVVIDVRTPDEFAAGHIEGAVNIDFSGSGFSEKLGKLDRDQEYLIHCRSGNRSGQSKETFTELGFDAVYHLEGGIVAWEEAGLPTTK